MESIPLPQYEAVPLDDVAPGVRGLNILFVNVYAVQGANGGWTLIDAGLPFSTMKIKHWIEHHFGNGARPDAIILTHGHFDHVGASEELVKEWNVPVYAHADELRYLNGETKYPPPDPSVGGGLMAVMSPLYPRTSANLSGYVRALPADGSVPTLPGWRWIHTPGHAPGHISLYRNSDGTLIVGDAFCTTKTESFLASTVTEPPELHGPPAYYTPDWTLARESVRQLATLRPTTLAPGHGRPMAGIDIAPSLEKLAADFDRIAMPEHGRYVDQARATST
jgi:glyoxylase-like metal-dependent hydrolase (beta-lactamase superfamily II)